MTKLLCACTTAMIATGALAQSSVTVFGTLDTNIIHTSQAGASRTYMAPGGYLSSLLGIRGQEDLGGGMSAGFFLESSLGGDTGMMGGSTTESGNSKAFFNRRSTVSLAGPWGEVRLGRDYVPSFGIDAIFDPFGTQSIGSAHIIAMHGTNWGTGGEDGLYVRASNSVSWLWGFKPHDHAYVGAGGLYGNIMYSFPEKASGTPDKSNRYVGGRVGYKGDKFNAAASYSSSTGPVAASPTDAQNTTSALYSTYKTWSLGGKYSFDFGSLYAQYGVNKADAPGTKWTHGLLGATYLTDTGYLRGSFSRTRNNGLGKIGADQWALGYVHFLSKRTSLYATYAHLKPKGYATNTNALESFYPFNVGDDGKLGDPRGQSGNAYSVGISHSF